MLKEMNAKMEKELKNVHQKAEEDKASIQKTLTDKLKARDADIKVLQEEVRLKSRDLKQVRSLAQMILDQRSEIETFFLEAIEQVKKEKRKKAETAAKSSMKALPPISQRKNKSTL